MVTPQLSIFVYIIGLESSPIFTISQAHVSMHGNIGIFSIRRKTPKPSYLGITSSFHHTHPSHHPNIILLTFRWWMIPIQNLSSIHQILNEIESHLDWDILPGHPLIYNHSLTSRMILKYLFTICTKLINSI